MKIFNSLKFHISTAVISIFSIIFLALQISFVKNTFHEVLIHSQMLLIKDVFSISLICLISIFSLNLLLAPKQYPNLYSVLNATITSAILIILSKGIFKISKMTSIYNFSSDYFTIIYIIAWIIAILNIILVSHKTIKSIQNRFYR